MYNIKHIWHMYTYVRVLIEISRPQILNTALLTAFLAFNQVYPHLIFDNFSSKLGERTKIILQAKKTKTSAFFFWERGPKIPSRQCLLSMLFDCFTCCFTALLDFLLLYLLFYCCSCCFTALLAGREDRNFVCVCVCFLCLCVCERERECVCV